MKKTSKLTALILSCLFAFSACSSSEGNYSPQYENEQSTGDVYEESAPAEAPDNYTFELELEDAQWYFRNTDENYLVIDENEENYTLEDSLVTFSLKVDTASYSNIERYIESGGRPPKDAVKIEEMINYFSYDEKVSFLDDTFAIYAEVGPSILDQNKHMAFIRVKTEEINTEDLPPSNLTFLIDTSGSMNSHDKMPLLKEALALLVETLDEKDTVSIVTYAGTSSVVLDSVSGNHKSKIMNAVNKLKASGSTAGGAGIQTAYELAEKNFNEYGNNRIILASDGDFNVGLSSVEALESLITEKRESGVYLSVLGFGTGNIRDDIMETLAKHGNGNYSYINSVKTAEKVLVDELQTNLFTVADDVKAQVEFNPETVKSYRLIGYENRQMENRDFDNDKKDGGEIGAGTDIVLLFEIELQDSYNSMYKYKTEEKKSFTEFENELFEVRIRYKEPGEDTSKLLTLPVTVDAITEESTSDFRFASSVAGFGHILRGSEYLEHCDIDDVISYAKGSLGTDEKDYRYNYLNMLREYEYMFK